MPERVCCNLCGSTESTEIPERLHGLKLPSELGVVRCAKCSLMFLNPRPTQEEYKRFYESSELYSIDAYAQRAATRLEFYSRRVKALQEASGNTGRLLEVGCATGHFLSLAQEGNMAVWGTELSAPLADYARRVFGLDVKTVSDLADAAYPDRFFDVFYASHVVEHLLDPIGTLREAMRIVRDGGLVVVEVPYQFGSLRAFLRRCLVRLTGARGKGVFYNDATNACHHSYFFTPTTLTHMLRAIGLEVEQVQTYQPHHRQIIGDGPAGGYWLTEMMHRAAALVGLGPIILIWARKPCQ